jgi:hypothetical protein
MLVPPERIFCEREEEDISEEQTKVFYHSKLRFLPLNIHFFKKGLSYIWYGKYSTYTGLNLLSIQLFNIASFYRTSPPLSCHSTRTFVCVCVCVYIYIYIYIYIKKKKMRVMERVRILSFVLQSESRPVTPSTDSTESAMGEEDPNDPEWTVEEEREFERERLKASIKR